jgi:hypothetical protein
MSVVLPGRAQGPRGEIAKLLLVGPGCARLLPRSSRQRSGLERRRDGPGMIGCPCRTTPGTEPRSRSASAPRAGEQSVADEEASRSSPRGVAGHGARPCWVDGQGSRCRRWGHGSVALRLRMDARAFAGLASRPGVPSSMGSKVSRGGFRMAQSRASRGSCPSMRRPSRSLRSKTGEHCVDRVPSMGGRRGGWT